MRHLSTDLRRGRSASNRGNGRQRLKHPHLPPLFYTVQNRDWEAVLRRARTHPHEIVVQEDTSGNTPLHFACRLDPPQNVIQALMAASAERNNEGATVLHIAASHRCSAHVIDTLVRGTTTVSHAGKNIVNSNSDGNCDVDNSHLSNPHEVPLTMALTKMGRAPIHYACISFRGLSVDAFQILLEATIDACISMEETVQINKEGEEISCGEDIDEVNIYNGSDGDAVVDNIAFITEVDETKEQGKERSNTLTMQDYTGQTPLSLLFRRYRERVRCVIKMVDINAISISSAGIESNSASSSAAAAAVQADLGELWEKARLIVGLMAEQRLQREEPLPNIESLEACSPAEAAAALEAANWAAKQHQNSSSDDHEDGEDDNFYINATTGKCHKFRIVHASVGLTGYGCPPEMIQLAISIYPHQVREMDEDGNLPLHIAALASSFLPPNCSDASGVITPSDEDSLLSGFSTNTTASVMTTGSKPTLTKNPFDKVIKLLLRYYPAAAKIPHGQTGRLPLILAIEARKRTWNDGLKVLLRTYPAALETKDFEPKLYPSIMALVGSPHEESNASLVTLGVFEKNDIALFHRKRYSTQRKNKKNKSRMKQALNCLFDLLKARPNMFHNELYSNRVNQISPI